MSAAEAQTAAEAAADVLACSEYTREQRANPRKLRLLLMRVLLSLLLGPFGFWVPEHGVRGCLPAAQSVHSCPLEEHLRAGGLAIVAEPHVAAQRQPRIGTTRPRPQTGWEWRRITQLKPRLTFCGTGNRSGSVRVEWK